MFMKGWTILKDFKYVEGGLILMRTKKWLKVSKNINFWNAKSHNWNIQKDLIQELLKQHKKYRKKCKSKNVRMQKCSQ